LTDATILELLFLYNWCMNATKSFFSFWVSFVPSTRLKNSTVSSSVRQRPSGASQFCPTLFHWLQWAVVDESLLASSQLVPFQAHSRVYRTSDVFLLIETGSAVAGELGLRK
jgi:hypothetical protein